jgi:Uma2 family endonuclease
MRAKTHATIDDLYKVEGKAELVNGEIVEMPPAGDDPGYASGEIFATLRDYVRRTKQGRAYGDGVGFHVHLPHREAFSPDAAYHIGPRTRMRFLEGAPIFAVEVRSENDLRPSSRAGDGGETRRLLRLWDTGRVGCGLAEQ